MNDWFLFPEQTPPRGFVLVTRKGRDNRTVDILWYQDGTFTRQPAYGQKYVNVYGWKPLPEPLDEKTEERRRFHR